MRKILGLLTALVVAVRAADVPRQEPNIILILADDMGWRDGGCFGGTAYPRG